MPITLTKFFHFSASYEKGLRVYGHNYTLGVTIDAARGVAEDAFAVAVQRSLIDRLQSRDLSRDVDFLKGVEIADERLLSLFWPILEKAIAPANLRELTLDRDSRTRTTYSP